MEPNQKSDLLGLLRLVFTSGAALLTPDQLTPFIGPEMRLKQYKKGEMIVKCGEAVSRMDIVVSGGFYIMRYGANGTYTTIARVPAPDMIGATQVFSEDPYYYSDIFASADSLIVEADSAYFHHCVSLDASLAMIILSVMAAATQRNSSRLEIARIGNSADRLVVYLYRRWAEKKAPGKTLYIKDKHSTIASDIGVSVRTLYRAINRLDALQWLCVDKGGVLTVTPKQCESIGERYRQVAMPWRDNR